MGQKEHYAVISSYPGKLVFMSESQRIAETRSALKLKEVCKTVANLVFYIPKKDVKVALVKETGRKSHCPIKGEATYSTFEPHIGDNYQARSYEKALEETKAIEGLIAFNTNALTLISSPI